MKNKNKINPQSLFRINLNNPLFMVLQIKKDPLNFAKN